MAGLAGAALLVLGRGFLGYDAFWSLVWGRDIAHGRLPDFERQLAPTPHPLSNLVGALLAPLGDGAAPALVLLGAIAFGALGYAAYRLGAASFSSPVGVVFAAILLTREEVVRQQLNTYVDIPFLALVLGAAALEVRHPRRGIPVLALLALAGLLRPEAWPLSILYLVWFSWRGERRHRGRAAILALCPPLLWFLFDLLVTGNPLHSLEGTRATAEELARPRSAAAALVGTPIYIRFVLDDPVVIYGGVAGALAGLWLMPQRMLVTGVLALGGMASFLALGIAGLPVLVRYMALPSAMLSLFFALAVLGWVLIPKSSWARRPWQLAGAALAVLVALTVPRVVDRLDDVSKGISVQRGYQERLHQLVDEPAVHRVAHSCRPLFVPNHHLIPQLAFWLNRPVGELKSAQLTKPDGGLLISPATPTVQLGTALDPEEPKVRRFVVPRSYRVLRANTTWILYTGCSE